MIARSCFFAALLVGGYSVISAALTGNILRSGPTRHQANIVRVERVWHAKVPVNAVLVGTSLSACLSPRMLEPSIASIAQSGSGPATGLALVNAMPHLPKRLYVEVNMLHRSFDRSTVDYFTLQPMRWLRETLPFLRQAEQPVNLAVAWLMDRRGEPVNRMRPEQLALGLAYISQQNREIMPPKEFTEALDRLDGCLRGLRARGVDVVLVEFPLHPDVRNSPLYRQIFDGLAERFPIPEWEWLRPEPGVSYEVTDGLHLTTESAQRFADELLRRERSLM